MSLVLLNLSGGDCVDDIERLEADPGLRTLMLGLETHGMRRKERRAYERRFRKSKARAFPSASTIHRYLEHFHAADEEEKRIDGQAFIPAANKPLKDLVALNDSLIQFLQQQYPSEIATLDQDATLVETAKHNAYYCYKHFKSYQPLNTYWHEQGLLIHSEFRDGNVPAGYEQLRCFQASLSCLPESVKQVRLRSDSAGYQETLLCYCAQGKDPRFGVIEFAIAVRVSAGFKAAVAEVGACDWQPIYKTLPNGETLKTDQEWAEVCYVPDWAAKSKHTPDYRFVAIREVFHEQLTLDNVKTSEETLPFPTMALAEKKYKVFGLVSNRHVPGNELIQWHRERCGDSEGIHSIEKNDLAGGQLPSNKFGVNAAWWQVMVMTLNFDIKFSNAHEKMCFARITQQKTHEGATLSCHWFGRPCNHSCSRCDPETQRRFRDDEESVDDQKPSCTAGYVAARVRERIKKERRQQQIGINKSFLESDSSIID